jgi:PAS domain S-box-containing protein
MEARLPRWLAKAFELSSDGIAVVSHDHTLVRANRSWLAMHGLDAQDEPEIVGAHLRTFHVQAEIQRELIPFLDRLARAGSAQGALGQLRSDGEPFQTWTTGARVDGAAGDPSEPVTYVLVCRDLSAEKTAATALRRTAGFLDSIVDNIPDMVFVKSADDLRYVLMNRAGEELLGYAQGELVGKTDQEVLRPGEIRASSARDREVIEGKKVVEIAEEQIRTRHGSARWVHTKKIPVFDGRGGPRYLLDIVEDITERRHREEAEARLLLAREAVRVRDEFLSVASHQLNNPLGAARLHADALVRQVREPEGRFSPSMIRHVESLHRVLVRMTTLVSELLDVSKIEAGRVELHREEFDLGDLVRETADAFVDQLGTCGSELRILADGVVLGSWDRLRLGEVVANLVSNAIKFGQGRPIEVTVSSPDDGCARLTVADHGVGMSSADQRHVFERFERGDAGRAFPGSGLGLWIAHQMILAHHGSIRVASAPGQGATFIVELPLRADLRPSETRSAAECRKIGA